MVDEVRSVMGADAAAGQFDVLGGVYWYQGESDVTHAGWANSYQTHLADFVAALRTELPMVSTAPVVLAVQDLSQYLAYLDVTYPLRPGKYARYLAGNTAVRAADDWAAANLPDVEEVDTLPLARLAPTDEHLTDVGELALGDQLAKVSESLLP